MANTQSSLRRTKRSTIQASVNKIRKNKYKSAIRIMTNHLSKGKVKEAKDFFVGKIDISTDHGEISDRSFGCSYIP